MITHLDDDFIQSVLKKFGSELKILNLSKNGILSINRIEEIANQSEVLILAQNEINDINPISELTALKKIDLSDNNISDITPMRKLANLECVDLRGNRVSSLSELLPLAGCVNLRRLSLSGNPLCQDPAYPSSVFSLLPHVTRVDEWCREESIEVFNSHATNSSHLITDSETAAVVNHTGPDDDVDDGAMHRPILKGADDTPTIQSLKTQVEALEEAFSVQEKALAASVPSSSSIQTKLPPDFSYVQLLQLWRRQAVRNTYDRLKAEAATSAALAHAHKERSAMTKRIVETEANAIIWKEKYTVTTEKVLSLQHKLDELTDELKEESSRRKRLECELETRQASSETAAAWARQVQIVVDSQAQNSQMVVARCTEALRDLEARLVAANDRVRVAATLVSQKDVQLRNSLAALEAERRHLSTSVSSSQQLTTYTRVSTNNAVVIAADSGAFATMNNSSVSPLFSELKIRPEVEGLLKSIFRQLDVNDSGCVSLQLLADCFLAEEDGDDVNQLQEVVRSVLGEQMWVALVKALSRCISQVEEEEGHSCADVTWGEFLLLLLPASSLKESQSLRSLDRTDMVALRQAGVWGDEQWGMVSLVIPSDFQLDVRQAIDNLTRDSAIKEVRRLHQERSYLLSKLQSMVRELDLRAEGIKAVFESELSLRRAGESRLHAEITELREQLLLHDDRVLEMESTHKQRVSLLEARLFAAEEDCNRLKQEATRRTEELSQRTLDAVTEERERYARLESEFNMLQREASRKEVLNKGLQRDVQRLQVNLTTSDELVTQMRIQNEELQRQLHDTSALAAGLSEKVAMQQSRADTLESQNASLSTQLEELRAQIEELTSRAVDTVDVGDRTGVDRRGAEVQTDDVSMLEAASAGADRIDASTGAHSRAEALLREEMDFLRALPSSQRRTRGGSTRNSELSASPANVGETDVYAAHLDKLLKLAEAAIHRSS